MATKRTKDAGDTVVIEHVPSVNVETMATPESLPTIQVPVDRVFIQGGDRAAHADGDGIAGLAADIAAIGLLHPLTVVAAEGEDEVGLPTGYVVVAGRRRLHAVRLLGWATVPVRVMTAPGDVVAAAEVAENVQRRALSPMEEARAVAALLAVHAAGDVAARLGFPLPWVVQTAACATLVDAAAEMYDAGRMERRAAVELARHTASRQAEFVASHAWQFQRDDEVITFGDVNAWTRERTMTLVGVPWLLDDASLVPAAGPCTTCPKQSSATPGLFDVDAGSLCLDRECHEAKVVASLAQRIAAVHDGDRPTIAYTDWGHAGKTAVSRRAALGLASLVTEYDLAKGKTRSSDPVAIVVDARNLADVGKMHRVRIKEAVAATPSKGVGGAAVDAAAKKREAAKRKDDRRAITALVTHAAKRATVGTAFDLFAPRLLRGSGLQARHVAEAAETWGIALPALYAADHEFAKAFTAAGASRVAKFVTHVLLAASTQGQTTLAQARKGLLGAACALADVDVDAVVAAAAAAGKKPKAAPAPKARAKGGKK